MWNQSRTKMMANCWTEGTRCVTQISGQITDLDFCLQFLCSPWSSSCSRGWWDSTCSYSPSWPTATRTSNTSPSTTRSTSTTQDSWVTCRNRISQSQRTTGNRMIKMRVTFNVKSLDDHSESLVFVPVSSHFSPKGTWIYYVIFFCNVEPF